MVSCSMVVSVDVHGAYCMVTRGNYTHLAGCSAAGLRLYAGPDACMRFADEMVQQPKTSGLEPTKSNSSTHQELAR